MEHTPGPWIFENEVHSEWIDLQTQDRSKTICRVFVEKVESDTIIGALTGHANARLIASAPETAAENERLKAVNAQLLEACHRASQWLGKMIADEGHLNSVAPDHCIRTLRLIEAALAAAEGGK